MLYLIRHGEALGNAQGRIMGQTDLPLTARGRQQAEALARWFTTCAVRFAAVYSSDLERARDTAEILAAACAAASAVLVRTGLRELGRGALEGRTFAEAAALRALPETMAGFEPEAAATARILRVGAELRIAALEHDVAAVAHGGSLARLLAFYLGLPAPRPGVGTGMGSPRLVLDNTGVTVVGFEPGGSVALHRFNGLCHLGR